MPPAPRRRLCSLLTPRTMFWRHHCFSSNTLISHFLRFFFTMESFTCHRPNYVPNGSCNNLTIIHRSLRVFLSVCPTFYSETIGATDVKLGGWVQLGMRKNQFMFVRLPGSRSRSNFKLLRSGSNLGKVILSTGRVGKTYGEGGRTGSRSRSNFKLL